MKKKINNKHTFGLWSLEVFCLLRALFVFGWLVFVVDALGFFYYYHYLCYETKTPVIPESM